MKHKVRILGVAIALLSLPSISNAAAPAYKVDISFGEKEMKANPICVSVDAKDQVVVLLNDGTVMLYDTDGKVVGNFKSSMKTPPTTMTLADGKIYLFNTDRSEKTVDFQGKKLKRMVSNGIGCHVYDAAGAKVAEIKLPDAQSAADAHFIGKELAIGDLSKSQILYYEINGSEGKVTRKIDKVFRLCCGIFDFCPGTTPDSLIVANLGAFKVQTFTAGKKSVEFGQRGSKPDEFHGCCNPVNVGVLTDGCIITVEKSPTRVKIFDKEGKTSTKITGLTELVQGCSTIPIAVDSKGSIYLASEEKKCVVKCVPGISDKPEPAAPKEDDEAKMPEMSAGMKQIVEKCTPLMEAKAFDKAKVEAEVIMKAHPEMADEEKAQIMLGIGISPHMEKGDAAAAEKVIDEIKAAYPNTTLAKQADQIKKSIASSIEMIKEAKKVAGEAEGDTKEKEAPEK
jgi:hypothetical protein